MLYPALASVAQFAPLLRIARHSHCVLCSDCSGLKPANGLHVTLDDATTKSSPIGNLEQYGSDDEDDSTNYLDTCSCGHDAKSHHADQSQLGNEEYMRRARVALRLDELLQDVNKLLDFHYIDDDILSLRKQMQLPVSSVAPSETAPSTSTLGRRDSSSSPMLSESGGSPLPSKRRRLTSPSSDAQEEAESRSPLSEKQDSQQPGSTGGKGTGKRSGGGLKGPSMQAKDQTAPQVNGHVNGVNGHAPVKVEEKEKLDKHQLDRLATGVTVDTGGQTSPIATGKAEKPSAIELRRGVIKIVPVENDGQERSLIILTGLKTLFQKQLPKMPREYIARLVYDSNSKALAIIKRGLKIVGGICYRPFPHRGFAEIVFFATNSYDQVKGYGGMLMDHFKAHIKQAYPDMMHFLTYADNYAVGYFEKQGFSKDISLDRSVWAGYIKDYEGGTIMQCTILRKFDYLNKSHIFSEQREAILSKIREKSRSHIVYTGLQFKTDENGDVIPFDPKEVPGLRESGWNPQMALLALRAAPKSAEYSLMERLLADLVSHPQAWAFLKPVNAEEVKDYYDVITDPMDFGTMGHKLESNQYDHLDSFIADAQLVFDNCKIYNPEGSVYHKSAIKLEKFLKDQLRDRIKKEEQ